MSFPGKNILELRLPVNGLPILLPRDVKYFSQCPQGCIMFEIKTVPDQFLKLQIDPDATITPAESFVTLAPMGLFGTVSGCQ